MEGSSSDVDFEELEMGSKKFSRLQSFVTPEEEDAFNEYEDYLDLLEDQDDEEYLDELYKDQMGN
jgi:hypothetical protein